jgi:hypothetical protein
MQRSLGGNSSMQPMEKTGTAPVHGFFVANIAY